ncbi:MAG: hypothetical protein LBJ67_00195 [Planctomycetaceae bacterium]|jgi:transcriptional regulator with XRE-family HTH domain|nr:hypothetical protein [Planctomycetaceae bacterium]
MLGASDSHSLEIAVTPVSLPLISALESDVSIVPQSSQQSAIDTPSPLHRLAEARKTQDVSAANMARHLNCSVAEVYSQEKPTSDILLSRLYQWRDILDVPILELLVEPDDAIEDPIRSRAVLVRMMKTVRSILEHTKEKSTQWMAQTLFEQLLEIMPELREVTAWPTVGQSRETKDYGQAAYRRFDSNVEESLME